jgi:hypothetical protein
MFKVNIDFRREVILMKNTFTRTVINVTLIVALLITMLLKAEIYFIAVFVVFILLLDICKQSKKYRKK